MSGELVSSVCNSATTDNLPGTKWHNKCCNLGKPGVLVTRAIALLLLICLAESASGSCLSYGHSCWGAHGKRSGPANEVESYNWLRPAAPASAAEAWYFAKVLGRLPPNSELVRRSGSGGGGESLSRADIARLWQLRRVAQREEDANPAQDKFNASADDNIEVDPSAAATRGTRDIMVTGGGHADKDRLMQMMREVAEEK